MRLRDLRQRTLGIVRACQIDVVQLLNLFPQSPVRFEAGNGITAQSTDSEVDIDEVRVLFADLLQGTPSTESPSLSSPANSNSTPRQVTERPRRSAAPAPIEGAIIAPPAVLWTPVPVQPSVSKDLRVPIRDTKMEPDVQAFEIGTHLPMDGAGLQEGQADQSDAQLVANPAIREGVELPPDPAVADAQQGEPAENASVESSEEKRSDDDDQLPSNRSQQPPTALPALSDATLPIPPQRYTELPTPSPADTTTAETQAQKHGKEGSARSLAHVHQPTAAGTTREHFAHGKSGSKADSGPNQSVFSLKVDSKPDVKAGPGGEAGEYPGDHWASTNVHASHQPADAGDHASTGARFAPRTEPGSPELEHTRSREGALIEVPNSRSNDMAPAHLDLPMLPASNPGNSEVPEGLENVWSRLDTLELEPQTASLASSGQPLSSIELSSPGHERVSVRVVESSAGLEVQVATEDREARQHLLGGLDELANRVHELSIGSVVEAADSSSRGNEFTDQRRGHQAPEWEPRRPRARKSGATFVFPGVSGPQSRLSQSPLLN